MAGIWTTRKDEETGEEVKTCCMLTTTPNELMEPIHNRMPVILHADDEGRWIDNSIDKPEDLIPLLIPYEAELMFANPVDRSYKK